MTDMDRAGAVERAARALAEAASNVSFRTFVQINAPCDAPSSVRAFWRAQSDYAAALSREPHPPAPAGGEGKAEGGEPLRCPASRDEMVAYLREVAWHDSTLPEPTEAMIDRVWAICRETRTLGTVALLAVRLWETEENARAARPAERAAAGVSEKGGVGEAKAVTPDDLARSLDAVASMIDGATSLDNVARIQRERDEARKALSDVYERCAKVAREFCQCQPEYSDRGLTDPSCAAHDIAAAIRALDPRRGESGEAGKVQGGTL